MSQPSLPPEEPAPQRSRVAERLLNQPLRNLGVGVTALILGVTAAFGGLEEAEGADAPVPVTVGTAVSTGPFDITVKRLLWVDELPGVYTSEKGNRWLAIVTDVKNTTDHTERDFLLSQSLTISGVEGLVGKTDIAAEEGNDRIMSTEQLNYADSNPADPLQPGLVYPVVLLFEQKAASEPSKDVKVHLSKTSYRQNSLVLVDQWLDPTVMAESTLPVQPMKETAASPDTDTDTGAAG